MKGALHSLCSPPFLLFCCYALLTVVSTYSRVAKSVCFKIRHILTLKKHLRGLSGIYCRYTRVHMHKNTETRCLHGCLQTDKHAHRGPVLNIISRVNQVIVSVIEKGLVKKIMYKQLIRYDKFQFTVHLLLRNLKSNTKSILTS